jgi:hypothetical protein
MDGAVMYRIGDYRTVPNAQTLQQLVRKKLIAPSEDTRPKNLAETVQDMGANLMDRLRPKQVVPKTPIPEPKQGMLERVRTAVPAAPTPKKKATETDTDQ